MNRRSRARTAVVLGLGLLIGANGCNTVVTPDTTIGELLDQITVGDVVEAFQAFAAGASFGGPGGFFGASLSADQRAQIEALQARLVALEANATKRPSALIERSSTLSFACAPDLSTLTRSVVPVCRSWTNMSLVSFVSPATRLVASETNAT